MIGVYTDGACSGNPGPGGWGVVICQDGQEKSLSGHCLYTTNNRMELTAVIEGLQAVQSYTDGQIQLVSDSRYVIDGITRWIYQWQANGWKTSQKKPVENQDLWQELKRIRDPFQSLSFEWIRGHSGHPYNEKADRLAVLALSNARNNLF